jgi:hypothetical protein
MTQPVTLPPASMGHPNTRRARRRCSAPLTAVSAADSSVAMVSQVNVEHVFGIRPRVFLELLREDDCPLEVTSVGKGRHVDIADFRRWLVARAKEKHAPETVADDDGLLSPEEQAMFGVQPRTASVKQARRTAARRR